MNTECIRREIDAALEACSSPNDIADELEEVVHDAISAWARAHGWAKWGDGNWREESACSVCGSGLPGICGHEKDPAQVVLVGLAAVERQKQAALSPKVGSP